MHTPENKEGHSEGATLMTGGSVRRQIVRFALPIFWGNLFQQLYNIVDSLVVGNFLGSDALAAVGSSGNIIFLCLWRKFSASFCVMAVHSKSQSKPGTRGYAP